MVQPLGFASSTADLATYAFTNVPFGAEAEDRTIIIMGAARGVNGCTGVAVTIGGVPAVVDYATAFSGVGTVTFAAHAIVPHGFAGTVTVATGATQSRCSISSYRQQGRVRLLDSATDDAPDTQGNRVQSATVDVQADGFVLAHGFASGSSYWTMSAGGDNIRDFTEAYDTYGTVAGVHVNAENDGQETIWAWVNLSFVVRFLSVLSYAVEPFWIGLPWQQMIERPEWEAAVTARVRDVRYEVAVLDHEFNEVGTIPAVSLMVDFDAQAAARWMLEVEVRDPEWVPTNWTGVFDGRSGVPVRPYWCLKVGRHVARVPLCTVWLEDPDIVETPVSFSMVGKGFDVVDRARAGGYGGHAIDVSGQTADEAMRVALEALGVDRYRITPTTAVVPNPYVLGGLDDCWKDVEAFASMAGCEVWADREGTVVSAPTPEPGTVKANWAEGPNCPVTSIRRSPRTSSIRNRVVVVSTSPDIDPITVVREDTDPDSPTWVGRRVFKVREMKIESETVGDVQGATNMAEAAFKRWIRGTDSLEVEAPARPDLDDGSLISCSSTRAGVTGLWRVRGWTLWGTTGERKPRTMKVRMRTRSLT